MSLSLSADGLTFGFWESRQDTLKSSRLRFLIVIKPLGDDLFLVSVHNLMAKDMGIVFPFIEKIVLDFEDMIQYVRLLLIQGDRSTSLLKYSHDSFLFLNGSGECGPNQNESPDHLRNPGEIREMCSASPKQVRRNQNGSQ